MTKEDLDAIEARHRLGYPSSWNPAEMSEGDLQEARMELGTSDIPRLIAEVRRLKKGNDSISEALNSGDGTYRP